MPGVCPRCLREVYFAEEKLALGKVWHRFCFSCRNCRKLLDSWTVSTHSGELFCGNCYTRLFATKSVRTVSPSQNNTIFPSVDTRNTAVSPCNSLFNCRCYCNEESSALRDKQNQDFELRGSSLSTLEKQRLRGGGSEEEEPEVKPTPETGGSKRCSDNEESQIVIKTSVTALCDPLSDPTAVTALYNRQHSVSQSTFSRPSSEQRPPVRPSSTPASGEIPSIRNAGNFNCSAGKKPGSPCRPNFKNHEHVNRCHRYQCRVSQRSNIVVPSEELGKDCRGGKFVRNYRNHLRKKLVSTTATTSIHVVTSAKKDLFFKVAEENSSVNLTKCNRVTRNIIGEERGNVDIINLEHLAYQEIEFNKDNKVDTHDENGDDLMDNGKIEVDGRLRGGCGGGGGGSGCCCGSGGGRTNAVTLDYPSHGSTVEGACGCSGRARSRCGSSPSVGGCCSSDSSGAESISGHSSRIGGCCSSRNYDENDEGACASKGTSGPRSPDTCSPGRSSLSPCSAVPCSSPCSDRKDSCPPAGCRPVRRKIARCNSPCIGNAQSCGGGGSCGSGCRGGCGKPGQICLPSRPCSIPPCQPHPRSGGSPCMPPRRCAPQPPCCRSPVMSVAPGNVSGTVGSGGSGCCRSRSPGRRSAGGGGSPMSMDCQQQDCQHCKLPTGCECLGGGQDCQRCGLKVYQAEMQIASGVPYHNICFSCFCCRKPLETLTYHENCGEIYCKQCYVRNFGPQGYGYSGVLQTPM